MVVSAVWVNEHLHDSKLDLTRLYESNDHTADNLQTLQRFPADTPLETLLEVFERDGAILLADAVPLHEVATYKVEHDERCKQLVELAVGGEVIIARLCICPSRLSI
jgi:hypothetical protein